jgi:hypothetical protein
MPRPLHDGGDPALRALVRRPAADVAAIERHAAPESGSRSAMQRISVVLPIPLRYQEHAQLVRETAQLRPGYDADPERGPRACRGPRPNRMVTLPEFDLAIDFVHKVYGTDLEPHLCPEPLVSLEATGLHRLADGVLDLTLRGDPDYLEKLANRHVELVFVHVLTPVAMFRHGCVGFPQPPFSGTSLVVLHTKHLANRA